MARSYRGAKKRVQSAARQCDLARVFLEKTPAPLALVAALAAIAYQLDRLATAVERATPRGGSVVTNPAKAINPREAASAASLPDDFHEVEH